MTTSKQDAAKLKAGFDAALDLTRKAVSAPLDLDQFEGHTPGPWEMPGTDGADYVICASPKGKRRTLAHAYTQGGESTGGYNANLIKSAPALLAECKRGREEMRDVAFLLLAQKRRGEALKWARGLTGNIGAPEQTAVRIEEVIDLSAERDRQRDQINALRETLKFARRIIGANECGTDDVLGLIDAALKVTP